MPYRQFTSITPHALTSQCNQYEILIHRLVVFVVLIISYSHNSLTRTVRKYVSKISYVSYVHGYVGPVTCIRRTYECSRFHTIGLHHVAAIMTAVKRHDHILFVFHTQQYRGRTSQGAVSRGLRRRRAYGRSYIASLRLTTTDIGQV